MAIGVSLGAKGRTKTAWLRAMGKGVSGVLHGRLSQLSGNWTGCLRSVLLPALFCELLLKGGAAIAGLVTTGSV